jgi:putative DNA methylase
MEVTQLALTFPITDAPIAQLKKTVPIDSGFPEEAANKLAEIESFNKHLFRPNTYLHKWWARRSGTTFRYILKQLVPDRSRQDYYSPGGLEGVTVLDPMMGGGTTLHEAIRLGANVIGYDIDPIPVLQAMASLTSTPLPDKTQVYNAFRKELTKRIVRYFKTSCPICQESADIQFTLYALRKQGESGEVLVVDSFVLREESNGTHKTLDEFYPGLQVRIRERTWNIMDKFQARMKGVNGKKTDILSVPFSERYIPLVIVGYCTTHKTFFKPLDDKDIEILRAAGRLARRNKQFLGTNFEIPSGPKSDDLIGREVRFFHELFFPRQLVYISRAQALLETMPQEHRLWMSLLLSTSLEFNAALCSYKGAEKRRPGAIRHVFSHHAYSFPYTALENNPVFPLNTSGTIGNLFETRIAAADKWARCPIERRFSAARWSKTAVLGEVDIGQEASSTADFVGRKRMFLVRQNDSTRIPLSAGSVDFVVTDPPYFDNVQYSDLSHFFRCWLRTWLPDLANWQYLVKSSAVAESIENESKFGAVLGQIWQECNRVLARPHGRLIFTYHHWRPMAWAQLSISLKKAGFVLVNSFVVHSENPISVHIMNVRSLKHDTILVLKPFDSREGKRWQRPEPVEKLDSYSFSKTCGQMTGWVLETDLSERKIIDAWENFVRG